MATVSNTNPQSGKTASPEPHADRRPAHQEPSPDRIAAEAAAIYPDTFDTPPSPEEIAAEAYAIYESRGRADGHHEDDWLEAERRCSARRQQKPQP